MKKTFAVILAASVLLTVSGCGNSTATSDVSSADSGNSSETTSSVTDATTTTADTAVSEDSAPEYPDYSKLTEEEIYDCMVERSLMTTGDMTRMANVLDRAANGEEITVAYIGGSITEGYHDGLTLTTEQKWVTMATDYIAEKYPSATVNCVNAGLSGTPSVLGNVRLERDVLASDPDIVFIEFAVNDGGETIYKNAYESMVRTLLTQEKDIAVVLLFTIVESGHTCQDHMSKIGNHYGLPMISLPDSIWVEMQAGRMTWDDYSGDQSHPHVEGSKMIRDLVTYYYDNVMPFVAENKGTVDKTLPEPLFSDDYMNMHFIDSTNLEVETDTFKNFEAYHWFKNGWMYKGKDGGSMKFSVDCAKLAMVFKANNSKLYADAEIYVDGEYALTVASNLASGWNNPEIKYIIDGNESAHHEVEIRIAGGENSAFTIMGFGYCD